MFALHKQTLYLHVLDPLPTPCVQVKGLASETIQVTVMATSEKEEALKRRIRELEEELAAIKRDGPKRSKIEKMTGEVVDSNPYRRVKNM